MGSARLIILVFYICSEEYKKIWKIHILSEAPDTFSGEFVDIYFSFRFQVILDLPTKAVPFIFLYITMFKCVLLR